MRQGLRALVTILIPKLSSKFFFLSIRKRSINGLLTLQSIQFLFLLGFDADFWLTWQGGRLTCQENLLLSSFPLIYLSLFPSCCMPSMLPARRCRPAYVIARLSSSAPIACLHACLHRQLSPTHPLPPLARLPCPLRLRARCRRPPPPQPPQLRARLPAESGLPRSSAEAGIGEADG